MKFSLFIILVTVALFLTPAAAQKASSDIWGKTIMSQPFDTKPFRAIKIPEWLQDTSRYAYCVAMLSNYDEAAACGVQMGELSFGDPYTLYYPSKFLKRNEKLPEDMVAKQVADYKKRGLRIIGAIPPCLQAQVWVEHPDWRAIPTNTTQIPEIDLKAHPEGGWLCQLGPWGDYMIEILAEILTKYPQTDGFGFDGIHHRQVCYCQHCREAYRKETGQEIPNVNMNDAAFRRYLLWEDRRMEAFIERMQTRLKGIKPSCALVSWTTNAGRFGHFLDIPRSMSSRMNLLFDAPAQEFWLDETNRGNTVVPAFANAYIWATTNHRVAFSEPYMMSHGNPYGEDSFPHIEMLRRCFLATTYGANASLAMAHHDFQASSVQFFKEITQRAPWLTHKQPEPWAALVMSDATRNFYGREPGKVEERYLANVFGFFRTAVEEHLPVTVINDWNLNAEDLAPYKVLILPNTACLSDEQAKAIAQFVRNGGGLVASVDTSLFDEMGNPRRDFALTDVFGAHYQGTPSAGGGKAEELDSNFAKGIDASYWEKRKNIFDFQRGKHPLLDLPLLNTYLGTAPVVFKGQAVAVGGLAPEVETVGAITPRESGAKSYPAMITNRVGKGKVVYMAAGFDSAYYLYPYPYQRLLTAQAIRWAAPEAFPIQVKAPMCVHATYFRQKKDGKERLVIHLYNDLNSSGNHAKPNEDVPLREEIIPIHDIKVTLRGYPITRLHLEPGGQELPIRKSASGEIEVTVPRLDIHSILVAELDR